MFPRISIVGKPNVGKSTLFNKLCGRRLAIVHDRPGVTRDTKSFDAKLGKLKFKLIDTAGLEFTKELLAKKMVDQAIKAASSSDLILFLVDARNGISPDDYDFANLTRKFGKKVLLLANKAEGRIVATGKDLARLGFGEAIFISSEHNLGFRELEQAIKAELKEHFVDGESSENESNRAKEEPQTEAKHMKLAIIGRPNVGKSSIFNCILGNERSIVSDISGTTRDAITDFIEVDGKQVEIVDTAGMRKKAKVQDSVENLSVAEAINALRRCNIAAIVLDAMQPLEKQDLTIAHVAIKEGKGVVLVVNKCDLIKDRKAYERALDELIEKNLFEIKGVPLVYVSALKNKNIKSIFRAAFIVEERWKREIKTAKLNQWLKGVTEAHIPPIATNGRRVRLKYATQTATKPTTITVFANMPSKLPDSYTRYLYNSLRESFDLSGVPIRIKYKQNENPYDRNNKQ